MAHGHPLFWFRSEGKDACRGDAFEKKYKSLLFHALTDHPVLHSNLRWMPGGVQSHRPGRKGALVECFAMVIEAVRLENAEDIDLTAGRFLKNGKLA